MIAHVNDLAAFVLAGGKSSRMGRDKAFLTLEDETLLDRALRLVRSISEDVRIVGDARTFAAYGRVVEDVYRERGPLGGIHAALSASDKELNVMLAVDMPFVEVRFLEYLIAEGRKSKGVVTVPQMGGRFQPLCAVYRRAFRELAEEALKKGENRIDRLFSERNSRILNEVEMTQAGFSAGMFRNLNTPEDLESALAKGK